MPVTSLVKVRLIAAMVAVLALPPSSSSWAASLDRFYVNGGQFPDNLVRGPDGMVWFTTSDGIGRIAGDGTVTLRRIPGLDPQGLTTGPDGALWFTESDNRIVRMATDGGLKLYSLEHYASALAPGPDGALWFVEPGDQRLGRITPDGQVSEPVRLPDGTYPQAIVTGPDGNLWFSYSHGYGRASPDGTYKLWPVGEGDIVGDGSIAVGPDGNLWVAGLDYKDLMRVTPQGVATHVTAGTLVSQVIAGPDGAIWFNYYYGVGSVAVDGSHRRTWPQPFGSSSDCEQFSGVGPTGGLAFDAQGTLWAGDSYHRSVERLAFGAASPSALEPLLPRTGLLRTASIIAAAPGGSVWVSARGALVRVEPDGTRRTFRVAGDAFPGAVLPVPDGRVWFGLGGEIRRLSPGGHVERFRRHHAPHAFIDGLAPGLRGGVWFIDARRRVIGRMDAAGRVREFCQGIGRHADLLTIAEGAGGTAWVTDQNGAIVRITPRGRITRFRRGLSRQASPTAITRGPDGNMWFTDFDHRQVGSITPSGRIRQWTVRDRPASIAIGPDHALWFTTAAASDIDNEAGVGRITVDGRWTEFYARDTCSTPFLGLVTGPDEKLWFGESYGNVAVARIDPRRLVETGQLPRTLSGARIR